MLLESCATVSQGSILSRIEEHPEDDSVELLLYTMKEMNESLGLEYHGSTEKVQSVHVSKEKVSIIPMTKVGMVLVNLTGHQAVAVREEHSGRLVPSNFAVIETTEKIDPIYLEWFFNKHPDCRKQLLIATQGSVIPALSIKMLRSLELKMPDKKKQQLIGSLNQLMERKHRLAKERVELEEKLLTQLSLNYLRKEGRKELDGKTGNGSKIMEGS